jgi:hypothetical protein
VTGRELTQSCHANSVDLLPAVVLAVLPCLPQLCDELRRISLLCLQALVFLAVLYGIFGTFFLHFHLLFFDLPEAR